MKKMSPWSRRRMYLNVEIVHYKMGSLAFWTYRGSDGKKITVNMLVFLEERSTNLQIKKYRLKLWLIKSTALLTEKTEFHYGVTSMATKIMQRKNPAKEVPRAFNFLWRLAKKRVADVWKNVKLKSNFQKTKETPWEIKHSPFKMIFYKKDQTFWNCVRWKVKVRSCFWLPMSMGLTVSYNYTGEFWPLIKSACFNWNFSFSNN